jgi:hypothetical protein
MEYGALYWLISLVMPDIQIPLGPVLLVIAALLGFWGLIREPHTR